VASQPPTLRFARAQVEVIEAAAVCCSSLLKMGLPKGSVNSLTKTSALSSLAELLVHYGGATEEY